MGNPEGFFEDAEIVHAHKELFEKLHTKPTLPLPDGWLESDPVKKARPQLRKILEERLAQSNTIWGFKDPRTVSFLPLWSQILNAPGVVPVFLLAVRNPATVATSLKRQINRAETVTELQWLQRTIDVRSTELKPLPNSNGSNAPSMHCTTLQEIALSFTTRTGSPGQMNWLRGFYNTPAWISILPAI
jgi:hypothetical protein